MELARTLKYLWRRRRLVAMGIVVATIAAMLSVYQVGLFPPSLATRTNVFATASTQILVDTPDLDSNDLANRANALADVLCKPCRRGKTQGIVCPLRCFPIAHRAFHDILCVSAPMAWLPLRLLCPSPI